MSRKGLVIVVVMVLAIVGGYSFGEWLRWRPVKAPADGFAVRYKEGDEARYHAEGEVSYSASGMSPPDNSFEFSYDVHMFVSSADQKGVSWVFDLTNIQLQGQGASGLGREEQFTVTVHPRTGAVRRIRGTPRSPTSPEAAIRYQALMESVRNAFPGLPQSGAVRPGDKWESKGSDSVSLPLTQGTLEATTKSTYEGNETRGATSVARITNDLYVPVDMRTEFGGWKVGTSGGITSQTMQLLDRNGGMPVLAESTLNVSLSQQGGGLRGSSRMRVVFKMTRN